MSIDKFTAEQLLTAIKNGGDGDQVADLYKQINGASEEGPTKEQVDVFIENQGKVVTIKGTSMTGLVERLNTSTRGFYPGGRYPIYVKILTDERTNQFNAIGKKLEYDIDQLEVMELGEQKWVMKSYNNYNLLI